MTDLNKPPVMHTENMLDGIAPPEYQWANPSLVPRHDGNGWSILRGARIIRCASKNQVLAKLKGWNPLQGVMVGMPGSSCYIPPMSIPELKSQLQRMLYQSQQVSTLMMLVFAGLSLCAATLIFTRESVVFAVIFLLAALMHIGDYRQLQSEHATNDRSLFYFFLWHGRTGRSGLVFWVCLCLGIGIAQSTLQHGLGGLEPLVIQYGAYFPAMTNGELWRLLTGSFFHTGLPHYFANFFTVIFVGPIAWLVVGPIISTVTFFLGSIGGVVAAYFINVPGYDSYLGISGGVFALFGSVVTLGFLDVRSLPRNLAIQYAWLSVICLIGAEMFRNTSTVGHLAGIAIGVISAIILYRISPSVGR